MSAPTMPTGLHLSHKAGVFRQHPWVLSFFGLLQDTKSVFNFSFDDLPEEASPAASQKWSCDLDIVFSLLVVLLGAAIPAISLLSLGRGEMGAKWCRWSC